MRALNRVHESLTLATAAPFEAVEARQMVATVKIIPFAVPRRVLSEALAVIGADPLIRVEAFKHRKAGLIITRLAQTKPSLIAKSITIKGTPDIHYDESNLSTIDRAHTVVLVK